MSRSARFPQGTFALIATRLMFYLGVQAAYFIGIVGVLTYELKASTMALAAAVGIFNLCIIVANACGGTLLDVKGPRVHTAATVAVVVASCLVYQIVEVSVASVLAMSAAFGFSCGMGFPYLTAYPAYLTHRSGELQQVNALLSVASNAAVAVGPAIGGIIASVFPAQRVFVFPAVLGVAAIVPAAALLKQIAATGMRSLHGLEDASSVYANKGMQGDAGEAAASVPTVEKGTFGDSVRTVMGSSALSLLFWGGVLAYAGYGAFDPLESLYYRDVLHVGIAWMGWLSSAAGVGSFAGAMLSLRVPNSWVNVRTLLLLIALQGAACLLYVGTPFVICALAGQVLLGCAFGMITPLQNTLVQMRAPKHLLGRVNSVMNAGFNGAGVIPLFAAPVLADMFGVQAVLLGASAFVLIVPIVCLALRRDAA
ncbi:MFS transporter [Enorma sp.]|uniref:MFS transporter n=1 Tax=Enorma sp. TaxID=1920692 RepID=UPI0025B80F9F|nr:MFS transporter [Enorma sp.]